MSTTTDASTVTGEAGPAGPGALLAAATPLVEQPPTAAGAAAAGAGTPADGHTPRDGSGPAQGHTALDGTPPGDGSPVSEEPPGSWLRIEKGSADPEEIAALTVVLCDRIAALRALAAPADTGEEPTGRLHGRRHRPHRSACWSGCWSC
ncbi:acyl-CoA carboxylase subunit epsilon [Streptomyces kronopolitis]|uniref:acyl-CoA carboxylase subunit epsilon n=1 Tax=Streptomyces kronopolitis TaxID=1612435 RepID=UPI0036C60C6E